MPKKKSAKKAKLFSQGKAKNLRQALKFVTIKKESMYGQALYGKRIYYEGKRPEGLDPETGKMNFGKHILETLQKRFGDNFRFVISKADNNIVVKKDTKKNDIYWVRISQPILRSIGKELRERTRDIKLDIVRGACGALFPSYFKQESTAYVPGTLARVLSGIDVRRMSDKDKETVHKMLPDFVALESMKSINLLKAKAQIESLRELEADLRTAIEQGHPERWWQTYIKDKILIIQQGYIRVIEKLNISVVGTKFPDFLLVTHDGYVDILEIKKPDTPLLRHDEARDNYYWDTELAKAIIQTENYIEAINRVKDTVRSELKDKYNIDLRVLRPRGIVLAGDSKNLSTEKEKDDFRLQSQSLKNLTILTYDELLARLSNYIGALEDHLSTSDTKPESI